MAVVLATATGLTSRVSEAAGRAFACASADCVPDLVSVSVASRRSETLLADSGGRGGSIQDLSADRRRVLIDQGLRLTSATISGQAIRVLADGIGDVATARWSPDGKLVAFSVFGKEKPCGSSDELWVVHASGAGLHKVSDCANYPAWGPDSKHVAFIGNIDRSGNGSVSVSAIDGNDRRDLVPWSSTSAPTIAWAMRGNRIAFTDGSGAGNVEIISADGTGPAVTIPRASSPSWRPDGRRLAIVRIDRPYDRLALELVSPTLSIIQRIDRGKAIALPAWSRDGRLAYVKAPISPPKTSRAQVFETRPGRTPRRLTNERGTAVFSGIFWSVRNDRVFYLRCRT